MPIFSERFGGFCDFADGDAFGASSVGGDVFVGNTVLVLGLLLVVLFVHVMIISAVEGYWLAQVRTNVIRSQKQDRHHRSLLRRTSVFREKSLGLILR